MDLGSIATTAGDTIPDETELRQKYEEAAASCEGAPPYDEVSLEDLESYLPHIHLLSQSKSWEAFSTYMDGHDERITRPTDVFQAMYPVHGEGSEKGQRGFEVGKEVQKKADADLALYTYSEINDYAAETMRQWMLLLPRWSRSFGLEKASSTHFPEFYWAPIRMMLAGAGHEQWSALAEIASDTEGCPFDPEEDEAEWKRGNIQAHQACGWPAQLIHIPYPIAARWVESGTAAKVDIAPPPWGLPLAMLHVLKHVRRDPDNSCRILYGGSAVCFELNPKINVLGDNVASMGVLTRALGLTGPTKRTWVHHTYDCLVSATKAITYPDLPLTKPLGKLPAAAFAGGWTRLVPEPPSAQAGFYNHQLRVEDAKLAKEGRIRRLMSDDSDVLDWAWNVTDPGGAVARQAKAEAYDHLPRTYEVGLPMDLFLKAFPNTCCPHSEDPDAYWALLESPIFATLLRDSYPWLRVEFPFVAVLPQNPTQHESTNNGKTSAVDCLAGALVPGLRALVAPDSSSAPDTRSIATVIRNHGTVALDEFILPRSPTHPLSKNNLQTLCTGRPLNSGRVLEDYGTVELEASVVLGAKFLEIPPDLVNRSFCLFLGSLTDEMRDDWETFERVNNGHVSMDMRLGALALCEDPNFIEALEGLSRASKGVFRFGGHRALAALLYAVRQGHPDVTDECFDAVDAAHYNMLGRMVDHADHAEEAGLIEAAETGRVRTLRFRSLMEEVPEGRFNELREYCEEGASSNPPRFSPLTLVKAVAAARGLNDENPTTFVSNVVGGSGGGSRWTERKISAALNTDLRQRAKGQPGGLIALPGVFSSLPWALREVGKGYVWVELESAIGGIL